MFPIYMWVDRYKGLENFEITFDNNYEIKYNREEDTLSINKKCESENQNIKNFYSIDKTKGNIDSVNLLIGKNGSGKTSVLRLLTSIPETSDRTFFSYKEIDLSESCYVDSSKLDYFIIYKDFENKKEEKFIIEKRSNDYNDNKDSDKIYNMGMARFYLFDDSDEDFPYFVANTYGRLNSSIKYQSKEKVYVYLNNQNKLNKKNFENTKMAISVKDLFSNSEYLNIIYNILIENHKDIFSDYYNLMRLYEIDENDDIKDIILKNYCNELFLSKILRDTFRQKLVSSYRKQEITKEFIKQEKENVKKNNSIEKSLKYLVKNWSNENFYDKIIKISQDISNLVKNNKCIERENNIKGNKLAKFYITRCKKDKEIKRFLEFYDTFMLESIIREILMTKEYKEDIKKIIIISEEGLSDGERIKLQYFSTLHGVLKGKFKDKKYVTLLFDEVETFLHPEWSRRFLYELIEELGRYKDKKFKLIFATHSPFLIADVLAKDCIYLEKENGKIEAKIHNDVKTFEANIIDLFKNTMFLESTFGKFATKKIKGMVDKIEKAEKYSDIKHEFDFIIGEIGEKLISNKLKSMIESKFENKDEEKDEEYYRKKIEEYQAKLGELEKKENNRNSKK